MGTRSYAAFLGLALLAGCGGSTQLRAGTLPAGATFYGVWQSPQYGNMHMCQTGQQIVGDYVQDERYGRIQGEITGDLMRFQWEDRRELVRGRPVVTRGRGYFRISVGDDGDQYLKGEWGLKSEDRGGGPWNAVRLRRAEPDRCMGGSDEDDEDLPEQVEQNSWDDEDADVIVEPDE